MALKGDTNMSPDEITKKMTEAHIPYIEEAGKKGVQVLCMQEVFTQPYFCPSQDAKWYAAVEKIPEGPTTKLMQEYAKKYNMVIVVPIYEEEMTGVYYNAAAVIDANGDYLGKYRKTLDLLVNNASVFHKTSLNPTTDKDWETIIAVNVRAPYYLSLSATPLLKKTEGSIINISDIHGNRPRKDYSIYCISKAALNALTLSLAIELAPKIRVNCIAPGAIIWARSETSVTRSNAVRATPLKRTGNPSDISDAVMYLTNSTYLTGQILNIDGGRSLNV